MKSTLNISLWSPEKVIQTYEENGRNFQRSADVSGCSRTTFSRYYREAIINRNNKIKSMKELVPTRSSNIDVFLDPEKTNVALFDIESTGLTGDFSCILCAVVKSIGSDVPVVFKIDMSNKDMLEAEKQMLMELVPFLESFDGLIGYYSTRFDMPMIRTRCMFHGIPAPRKIKHLDMYFTIKRTVNPTTRRMDRINELSRITNADLPMKTKLGVKEWTDATFRHSEESLNYIIEHCIHDVFVLESILNDYRDFTPMRVNSY